MNTLPLELLAEVAWNLPSSSDIRRFRLVSRAFAYASSPALFHRIDVINTESYLNELQDFQTHPSNSAAAARHLTLYHGIWPTLNTIHAWSQSPLAIRQSSLADHRTMQAYSAYRQFANREALRDFDTDILKFTKMLQLFPNLTSLTISHIHAWRFGKLKNDHYDDLSWKIRIIPFFTAHVEDVVQQLLSVLHMSPRVSQLSIQGSLDLRGVAWGTINKSILHLIVQSLVVCWPQEDGAESFLRSFPNLRELELGTEAGRLNEQKLPLRSLSWPDLKRVTFHHLWVSEDELVDFIMRHQLRKFVLHNVTLFTGTWESFFNRLFTLPNRALQTSECIMPTGRRLNLTEARTANNPWHAGFADTLKLQVYLTFAARGG